MTTEVLKDNSPTEITKSKEQVLKAEKDFWSEYKTGEAAGSTPLTVKGKGKGPEKVRSETEGRRAEEKYNTFKFEHEITLKEEQIKAASEKKGGEVKVLELKAELVKLEGEKLQHEIAKFEKSKQKDNPKEVAKFEKLKSEHRVIELGLIIDLAPQAAKKPEFKAAIEKIITERIANTEGPAKKVWEQRLEQLQQDKASRFVYMMKWELYEQKTKIIAEEVNSQHRISQKVRDREIRREEKELRKELGLRDIGERVIDGTKFFVTEGLNVLFTGIPGPARLANIGVGRLTSDMKHSKLYSGLSYGLVTIGNVIFAIFDDRALLGWIFNKEKRQAALDAEARKVEEETTNAVETITEAAKGEQPKAKVDFYPTGSKPYKLKGRYDDLEAIVKRVGDDNGDAEVLAEELKKVDDLYYPTGRNPVYCRTPAERLATATKLMAGRPFDDRSGSIEYQRLIFEMQTDLDQAVIDKRDKVNYQAPDIINRGK